MTFENISKIRDGRQDGAISNGYLFSFNHIGECTVYEMDAIKSAKGGEAEVFAEFVLDKIELLSPHSNSVSFGNEYFDEEDEFPLLYTNIYNNYANCDDNLNGVCLVYRIQRKDRAFKTTLVQMIEVGFVEDVNLWKSAGEKNDMRPYGNFTVDKQKDLLYVFTMRDNTYSTRYFAFELPKVNKGTMCNKYNIKKVVLGIDDIVDYFDCEYHHFIQGVCCHEGKIYSLEGFTDSVENPPAVRVIDTKLKKQKLFMKFKDFGINIEPEMICFENDICYYSDHHGRLYRVFW